MKIAAMGIISVLVFGECAFCSGIEFYAKFEQKRAKVILTWSNEHGSEPILVNIGRLTGSVLTLADTTTLHINGPNLPNQRVVFSNQPAGVAGSIIPFIICLLPSAEYALALDGNELRLSGSNQTLADLRDRRWTLSVLFTGRQAIVTRPTGQFVPYDGIAEYGSRFRMWIGRVEASMTN